MNRHAARLSRLFLSFVGLALLCNAPRAAEPPETYAVVAVVGDELSIVVYRPSVGSNRDTNAVQHVPNSNAHFDSVASGAAGNAIRAALPTATLRRVILDDRAMFGRVQDLGSVDGGLALLLQSLKPQLDAADAHYLVVVGKSRGETSLRVRSGTIGSGKLSGLGFFIDREKRMRRTDTGESGEGFISPFAYVMVTLIDVRTGQVVRSASASESAALANAGDRSADDPWDSLTAERKVNLLDTMLRRAVLRATPRVLAPA